MTITVLPNPAIYRRDTHAYCDSLGRLWVHGESFTSGGVNDLSEARAERYDPGPGTWSFLAAAPQYWYGYASMLDSSNRVVIATGFVAPSGTILNGTDRGAIYDPATNTWTTITVIPPGPGPNARSLANVIWWASGSQLWLTGGARNNGQDDTGLSGNRFETLWYSGGASGTWTIKASTLPITNPALYVPGLVAANGLVYIPGQASYNMSTDTWTMLATVAGGAAPVSCMDSGGRYIFHFGGSTKNQRYDTVTDTWLTTLAAVPYTINGGNAVAVGQYIYLIGGLVSFGSSLTNIFRYDTLADVWANTGDTLSVARTPVLVKDSVGSGFYVVQGKAPSSTGSNIVEYWNPGAAAVAVRAWAAVIG